MISSSVKPRCRLVAVSRRDADAGGAEGSSITITAVPEVVAITVVVHIPPRLSHVPVQQELLDDGALAPLANRRAVRDTLGVASYMPMS
jgi:hypothetical protein